MKQSTAVDSPCVRKGREVDGVLSFPSKKSFHFIRCFRLLYGFLCICKEDEQEESKRINHGFGPHTCVGENKSPDIRVFSLTRGLGTICGLLLRL